MAKQYETVIGLEVHVELATRTKIFCGCSTAFGGAPNTHTCPVCTGMPGSLPVLNKQVVEYAVAVGLAANCEITRNCKFDRKNYFYPEPDMQSAEEVIAYLEKLRLLIQYLGASDCKLQEGSMRADVNLSVREAGSGRLGVRTEMKNLNSFKAIARAIEGERQRQIELLEEGKPVIQETRRWDDNKEYSYAMRSKEDAQDYRYFPDPDLAPVHISEAWLQQIREKQPEFRDEKMARYKEEFNIPDYDIEILTSSKHLADLFEATSALCGQPKKVSNWLMVETLRLLKEKEMEPEEIRFSPENLASLIGLAERKVINGSVAKEVFEVLFEKDIDPEKYVEEKGLKTERDEGALKKSIEEIVEANPQSVEDYKNGKEKAIGFLVGQTMKAMKGKADPAQINTILREFLK